MAPETNPSEGSHRDARLHSNGMRRDSIAPRLLLALLSLLIAIPAASQPAPQPATRSWLRVRAEGLYGRRVELGDVHRGALALLAGVDPVADGLWLPLPPGTDRSALRIDPPLPSPPALDVVELPSALSDSWVLVPLPLAAWGVASLDEVASISIGRGQRGRFRASSFRGRNERASLCPPVRVAPTPIVLPARIADFEAGPLEPLRNRFGFFAGRGGTVVGERVRDGASSRLAITATLDAEKSYGGFWLQLAPATWLDDPEAGADARGLVAIAVRGHGTPRGVVKLSDVKASKREESVVVGTLDGAPDADGSWLRVLPVPEGKLDLSRLRSLLIDFSSARSGRLEVDEIVFLGRGQAAPPPFVSAQGAAPAGPPKAGLWVWTTNELLTPGSEWRPKLFATIARWQLSEVYLQLPHQDGDSGFGDWNDAPRSAALADLIRELHRDGVEAHALDGAAWLALPEGRGDLVALAESVRDYNASQPADARFDAIHLDVEPYLLPNWGGRRRPELAASLVESLTLVKQTVGPSIPLWLDIPFWYDSTEETTVEAGARPGCAKRDLLNDLFRVADGIGIMSYRTRADGADGLTSTALGELALGRDCAKPVRLGVETIKLPADEGWSATLSGPDAVEGKAAVAFPSGAPGYVLFTPSITAAELRWLKSNKYKVAYGEPEDSAPPSKISFYGRSADEIRAVVMESLELARRSGVAADGVAYHELRTLP
jgi:hypothetical protein